MKRDLALIDRDINQGQRIISEGFRDGITNDMIYGGLEEGQSVLQGCYEMSLTKNCGWGTRRITWDGQVFKYAKAFTGGVASEFGAANIHGGGAGNNTTGPTSNTISSHLAVTQVDLATGLAGCSVITVPIHTGDYHGEIGDGIVAANELVGGYAIINNGTSQHPDFRRIIANTACEAGTGSTIQITLDGPLFTAITVGTTYIEILANPYNKMVSGNVQNGGYVSFLGVPVITVATLYNFWLKTWGPTWITSDGATNNQGSDREVYFQNNGSIVSGYDVTYVTSHPLGLQRAGFSMEKTSSGYSGPPLVMLQVSI